jgi:hypothetical protein
MLSMTHATLRTQAITLAWGGVQVHQRGHFGRPQAVGVENDSIERLIGVVVGKQALQQAAPLL